MTRSLYPPGLTRAEEQDGFDPVIEGARHGLSRELSLSVWQRACEDAAGDTADAERRFHELAARTAACDGRLRPHVGRLTRVQAEIVGVPRTAVAVDELVRTPGRMSLVDEDM